MSNIGTGISPRGSDPPSVPYVFWVDDGVVMRQKIKLTLTGMYQTSRPMASTDLFSSG